MKIHVSDLLEQFGGVSFFLQKNHYLDGWGYPPPRENSMKIFLFFLNPSVKLCKKLTKLDWFGLYPDT